MDLQSRAILIMALATCIVAMLATVDASAQQLITSEMFSKLGIQQNTLQSLFPSMSGTSLNLLILGSFSNSTQNTASVNHDHSLSDHDIPLSKTKHAKNKGRSGFRSSRNKNRKGRHKKKSFRIVGGVEVDSNEKYPFMASIFNDGKFCSASIISANKVLTAVHCTVNEATNEQYPPEAFSVFVGSRDSQGPLRVFVASIIRPAYQVFPGMFRPDFAILVLNASLPTDNPAIKPICLSETPAEDLAQGTIVTTMGWGKTANELGQVSPILKEATLSLSTDLVCQTTYAFYDGQDCFCASWNNGGICQGDSGGPVVAQKDGKLIQVGVNSFVAANGCGPAHPMGFASTTTDTFINLAKPFNVC